MASYVIPQVEIHQLFKEIPVALQRNQVAFVFGPNYLLHRYSDVNEKDKLYAGEYDNEASVSISKGFFKYPEAVIDTEKIEKSYTKVFADDAYVTMKAISGSVTPYTPEALLAEDVGSYSSLAETTTDKVVLKVSVGSSQPDDALMNALASDIVGQYLSMNKTATEENSVKAPAPDRDELFVKILDAEVLDSSEHTLLLTIDEEISSDYSAADIAVVSKFDHLEITRNREFDPEKKIVNWKEDKISGDFGIKFNDAGIVIRLDLPHVELLANKDKGNTTLTDVMSGTLASADIYIECRELSTAASDTIHSITYASEVANALGAVTPDNPLAQAVYNAALNSGGQLVRYMAIPSDDDDGWNAVLNAASLTKEVYFLVPVTRDEGILELVQSHVNAMSEAHTKRWRIAFISAKVPEIDPIYTKASSTAGEDFHCRVKKNNGIDKNAGTATIEFVVENGDDSWVVDPDVRFKKDLNVNDILYTNEHNEWGEKVFSRYRIIKVVNNYSVIISVPNVDELEALEAHAPMVAEVYHPFTNAEKAEQIRNLSSSFSDRRMYNVFPPVFVTDGVLQSGEFAAACVAGLVSSCLPQQPITNLELVGINDIPLAYQTFSFDQLNTMASGGTFIVMQDLPNDQVYVRHQISTDFEANNLNTAELSITKNLDSISYFLDDLTSPYIGKYNITPELIAVLRNVINSGLVSLESNSYGLYGAQLISEGTEIVLLEQDALLKDHVNCTINLNMPYPFNHLVLKLFV